MKQQERMMQRVQGRRDPLARIVACLIASLAMGSSAVLAGGGDQRVSTDASAVQRVLDDYIGLYRRDRLEEWKALFLPGFTATYTSDDGSVTTRSLEEFYQRQRAAFERDTVNETLENVRILRAGRLAHVFADFHFTSGTVTRPGQLMLLMIAVKGQFKIAALTFTYQLD